MAFGEYSTWRLELFSIDVYCSLQFHFFQAEKQVRGVHVGVTVSDAS